MTETESRVESSAFSPSPCVTPALAWARPIHHRLASYPIENFNNPDFGGIYSFCKTPFILAFSLPEAILTNPGLGQSFIYLFNQKFIEQLLFAKHWAVIKLKQ